MFFKNIRQRNPLIANHPQVQAMKEKHGKKKGAENTAINRWGCPTFYMETPVGEDERTTDLYREKLLAEFEAFPTNRVKETVSLYMNKTLHDRRRMVKDMVPVARIIEQYPILGEGEEVGEL